MTWSGALTPGTCPQAAARAQALGQLGGTAPQGLPCLQGPQSLQGPHKDPKVSPSVPRPKMLQSPEQCREQQGAATPHTQQLLPSTPIHQNNPLKSFTVRTWRWQQHIITNISSFYMVIIYSIFFLFFISATQTEDYFMLDIILIFDPFFPPT